MKELTGPELKPASGNKAKQLVILLHGLGSNGKDLIQLAEERLCKSLPDAHFISPNAPIEMGSMMTFYGFVKGYQWFEWLPDSPEEMLKGALESDVILNHFIDTQLDELGLEDKELVLLGFSQGTVMSLLTGLNRKNSLAGILGYSGAFLSKNNIKNSTPVCLIHGTADDVVPFSAMRKAEEELKKNNINVESHPIENLGHGINEEALKIGEEFIKKALLKNKYKPENNKGVIEK